MTSFTIFFPKIEIKDHLTKVDCASKDCANLRHDEFIKVQNTSIALRTNNSTRKLFNYIAEKNVTHQWKVCCNRNDAFCEILRARVIQEIQRKKLILNFFCIRLRSLPIIIWEQLEVKRKSLGFTASKILYLAKLFRRTIPLLYDLKFF